MSASTFLIVLYNFSFRTWMVINDSKSKHECYVCASYCIYLTRGVYKFRYCHCLSIANYLSAVDA